MVNLGVNMLEAWEGETRKWEAGREVGGKSKGAEVGPEQWEALPCPKEGRTFRHLQN